MQARTQYSQAQDLPVYLICMSLIVTEVCRVTRLSMCRCSLFLIVTSLNVNRFIRDWLMEVVPIKHMDFTSVLPRCLSLYILSFLNPMELCKAAQVSWHWKFLAEQVHLNQCTVNDNLRILRHPFLLLFKVLYNIALNFHDVLLLCVLIRVWPFSKYFRIGLLVVRQVCETRLVPAVHPIQQGIRGLESTLHQLCLKLRLPDTTGGCRGVWHPERDRRRHRREEGETERVHDKKGH